MSITQLFGSRNFVVVNKTLIKLLGLEEAVILGELASEYDYWEGSGQLDDEGYFFSTVENVEENTSLTKYRQKKALDTLQKLGIVDVKRKGLPAKRYIKIYEEALLNLLNNKKSKNLTSGSEEILPLEIKIFDRNNNNNNNNNDNNNNKKEERKKEAGAKQKDTKKSFDEIIDRYTANQELRKELKEHLKTRKAKKATLTNRAIELSLRRLDELADTDEEKILIVQEAIMRGWTGFFSIKDDTPKQSGKSYNSADLKHNPFEQDEKDVDLENDETYRTIFGLDRSEDQ